MSIERHQMIMASAGAGKTHTLCLRLIGLLICGVEPSRIVALTFTRKAAGEFLSKLLTMLAHAADDHSAAEQLAAQLEPLLERRPDRSSFAQCLERVVAQLDRLNLCTIDSFFSRVIRAFPFEFGLTGEFELLDTLSGRQARERALREAFGAVGARRRGLVDAFRQASVGGQAKQAARRIHELVDDYHAQYLLVPDGRLWGRAEAIWGSGGCPWPARIDVPALVATIEGGVDFELLHSGGRKRLEDFCAATREWRPGMTLPKPTKYLFKNAAPALAGLAAGSAGVVLERRKVELDGVAARALAELVAGWIGHEIRHRLTMTAGLHAVLDEYDACYERLFRARGALVFGDLPLLLTRTDAASARLDVDFRLDARFDHWLFDEFQDTSRLQWRAVADWIDEVVQDDSGRRSLFYVGDVKQSIFSWRGGDPRLFHDVRDRYNRGGRQTIAEQPLNESWRSAPAVLDMVNAVFGDQAAMREIFPAPAVARWREIWQPHTSSARTSQLPGYSCLLEHDETTTSAWSAAARVIAEAQPLERGLSCALIVRTNDNARECVETLRQAGLPALRDGVVAVGSDSPPARMLAHLLRLAIHPGDSYARAFLDMGPLGSRLRSGGLAGCGCWDDVGEAVRRRIESDGFADTVADWLRRALGGDAADRFTSLRCAQLQRAAAEFDRDGGGDIEGFIDRLEAAESDESGVASAVQVMTTHKAKGLGFDMVVLPDLDASGLSSKRQGLARGVDDEGHTQWLLELPKKEIAQLDKVLGRALERSEEDAAFEAFCALYVAMTRARQGVYAIAQRPSANSRAAGYARWLFKALDGDRQDSPVDGCVLAWESGDPAWFRQSLAPRPPESAQPAPAPPVTAGVDATDAIRLPSESTAPSAAARDPRGVAGLVGESNARALQLGSRVHELLARFEWPTPEALADVCPGDDPAGSLVRAALAHAAVRRALGQPSPAARALREREFDVLLDTGDRIAGVFDRLVVDESADGATTLLVQDFKTDQLDPAELADQARAINRHRSQLESYRAATCALFAVPPAAVRCQLIYLRYGLVAGH